MISTLSFRFYISGCCCSSSWGGGETYQQNSVLRRDRDFLYKIPNEANIKCQLWYFIQWFKILPLGGVRPKFAKLGQFLEKSLLNKTFREH
jgi:hypothetical protein